MEDMTSALLIFQPRFNYQFGMDSRPACEFKDCKENGGEKLT